jgi:hypothetical protein
VQGHQGSRAISFHVCLLFSTSGKKVTNQFAGACVRTSGGDSGVAGPVVTSVGLGDSEGVDREDARTCPHLIVFMSQCPTFRTHGHQLQWTL